MTLEEQERRAYADGDVERAALLATAIDGSEDTQHKISVLEHENDELRREIQEYEDA